jgi:hypothetical protein
MCSLRLWELHQRSIGSARSFLLRYSEGKMSAAASVFQRTSGRRSKIYDIDRSIGAIRGTIATSDAPVFNHDVEGIFATN